MRSQTAGGSRAHSRHALADRERFRLRLGLEIVALDTVQFAHEAFQNDRADIARDGRRKSRQIGRCADPKGMKANGKRFCDAPDLMDRPLGEEARA